MCSVICPHQTPIVNSWIFSSNESDFNNISKISFQHLGAMFAFRWHQRVMFWTPFETDFFFTVIKWCRWIFEFDIVDATNMWIKSVQIEISDPRWPQVTYLDPTAKLNVMLNIFVGVSFSWGTYAGWFWRPGSSSLRLLFTFIVLKTLRAPAACSSWLMENLISKRSFIHSLTFIMFILFVSFIRIRLPRTIQC